MGISLKYSVLNNVDLAVLDTLSGTIHLCLCCWKHWFGFDWLYFVTTCLSHTFVFICYFLSIGRKSESKSMAL